MMFYNKRGTPIVYTDDNIHIFLFTGEPVAYIKNHSVLTFEGKLLGFFHKHWIYDREGNKVFFTKEAKDGVPIKDIWPIKGPKQNLPIKTDIIKQEKLPISTLKWSDLSNKDFFYRIESK